MPEMKYIHSPAILVALCYVSGSIIWCFLVGMKEIICRPNAFWENVICKLRHIRLVRRNILGEGS